MTRRFLPWLIVLIVLAAATAGLAVLLHAQGAPGFASLVVFLGQIATYAWVVRGLWVWRHVGWVAKTARLIIFSLNSAFFILVCQSLGYRQAATMFLGIFGMGLAFMLGLEVLRLLLSPGYGVLGVARTLLDEAIRMKMALIFVVMLVLLVPFLPFTLAGETRLQYRVESFLTYSLIIISTLMSFMTILLAVRTVTSELSERQAFLTLTKPVSRSGYLLGKWIGIMALNLLLMAVAGVGVFAFVQVIASQQEMDALDRQAVTEQVLVARESAQPQPVLASALQIDFKDRIEALRLRNPERFGSPDEPISSVTPEQRRQVELEAMREWMTIQPRNSETYRFTGLTAAKEAGRTLQVRIKPKLAGSTPDNRVRLNLRVNDRPFIDARLGTPGLPPIRDNTFHTLYIDSQQISPEGVIDLTIANVIVAGVDQPSVSFAPGEGLELFYRVGGFGTNLAKGLLVLWVRMGFLAALGLAASTFLGFPVACLLCFLVYFAAVGSDYLSESLSSYAAVPKDAVPWWDKIWLTVGKFFSLIGSGELFDAFKLVIRVIGEAFTFVVPPMARYAPITRIADGRAVGTDMLLGVVWRIGIVSSGVVGAVAAAIFSRKEIAKVVV